MTLYLVKWDDGSFALVSAEDDDALFYTLDQLGDPGAASWQVYDGPLWLEFPPLEKSMAPKGHIDPFDLDLGRAAVPDTDDGSEFTDAVLTAVHPKLSALRRQAMDDERPITRAEFDQAVTADRDWALPGSVFGSAGGTSH